MPEMMIESPTTKTILEDYDVVSVNGMMMPITINATLGDTIELGPTQIVAHLVAKPSINDPNKLLPAEHIIIYTAQVFSIQHRTREVTNLTPEQRFELDKTYQELASSTVH